MEHQKKNKNKNKISLALVLWDGSWIVGGGLEEGGGLLAISWLVGFW